MHCCLRKCKACDLDQNCFLMQFETSEMIFQQSIVCLSLQPSSCPDTIPMMPMLDYHLSSSFGLSIELLDLVALKLTVASNSYAYRLRMYGCMSIVSLPS